MCYRESMCNVQCEAYTNTSITCVSHTYRPQFKALLFPHMCASGRLHLPISYQYSLERGLVKVRSSEFWKEANLPSTFPSCPIIGGIYRPAFFKCGGSIY